MPSPAPDSLNPFIQAKDGRDFYRQVSVFAYGSFLEMGNGCVVVSQHQFKTHPDGRVESVLGFLPSDSPTLPDEARDQSASYDPINEAVMALVDDSGKATVLTLTSAKSGMTPLEAFKEAIGLDSPSEVLMRLTGAKRLLNDARLQLADEPRRYRYQVQMLEAIGQDVAEVEKEIREQSTKDL